MTELKTKPNNRSVDSFISTLEKEKKRDEARIILKLMKDISQQEPVMWGENIIGFGRYHYQYKSGHKGNWFVTGFSPRKQNLVIYIMPGFSKMEKLLNGLGKHKTGKSCLYINKLDDVDLNILEIIIKQSIKEMKSIYSCD